MDAHLRRVLPEGATLREVLEGLGAAAIPGGFTMLHYALPFLINIHEELEAGTFAWVSGAGTASPWQSG